MKQSIVALVPVREGSKRVKNKNFRNFYNDLSLFELKINQLKKEKIFDKIYVSSNSLKVKKICKDLKIKYLKRDKKMCIGHKISWQNIFSHFLDTVPGNPIICLTLSTSPLFNRYSQAIKSFKKNKLKYDSLVGVFPRKNFLLDKKGKGINFNPGYWHPYSQQLETNYEITGSVYVALKSNMKKWSYWFGENPYLFKIFKKEAIDVDNMEDFKLAQNIINFKK